MRRKRVLTALKELGGTATPLQLRYHIRGRLFGFHPSHGSVYNALDRLEWEGRVTSTLGEPTLERGGRPPRIYQLIRG